MTLSSKVYDLASNSILYQEQKEVMISSLLDFLKDEEIDIFTRWCYFMKYCGVLPLAEYSRHRETNFHNMYEMERHRTYKYSSYLEDFWLDLDSQDVFDEELVKSIREDFETLDKDSVLFILNSGECGFTFDW